jgi:hypothetical protein
LATLALPIKERHDPAAAMDFFQMWRVPAVLAESEMADPYHPGADVELLKRSAALYRLQPPGQAEFSAFWFWRMKGEIEATATPFCYSVFSILSLLPYETAYGVFAVVGVVGLLWSIGWLARCAGLPTLLVPAFWVLFSVGFEAFHSNALTGNLAAIQVSGVTLGLALLVGARRPVDFGAAGFLFAALAAFKPNTALVFATVSPLLWASARKACIGWLSGAVAGGGVAWLISSTYFRNPAIWLDWVAAMRELRRVPPPLDQGNMALPELIGATFGIDAGGWIAAAAILLTLVGFWFVGNRLKRSDAFSAVRRGPALRHAVGLGVIAGLVVPFLTWTHYLLLAIPALAVNFGGVVSGCGGGRGGCVPGDPTDSAGAVPGESPGRKNRWALLLVNGAAMLLLSSYPSLITTSLETTAIGSCGALLLIGAAGAFRLREIIATGRTIPRLDPRSDAAKGGVRF